MDERCLKEIGLRLRRLRIAEGYPSPGAWAKHLEVKRTRWLNWEAGTRLMPLTAADRLYDLTGVTLDWIYHRQEHALPEPITAKLRAAPENPPPPRTGRPRKAKMPEEAIESKEP